jgi:predicted nucleic acid-binding protein
LSVCVDTSFLVGLFVETDAYASAARTYYAATPDALIVSDFVDAEFASVIARLTRMRRIRDAEARGIFTRFDIWRAREAEAEDINAADIRAATSMLRRLDLNVRAPDAINLAFALRLGASVLTFDQRMADNARALGITVAAT